MTGMGRGHTLERQQADADIPSTLAARVSLLDVTLSSSPC